MKIMVLAVVMFTAALAAEKGAFPDQKRQESFWQVYTSALRDDKEAQYQVGVMYERGILKSG